MIQAQSTARKKLVELLKPPHPRLIVELAQVTISELKSIKRRAAKDEYTITFDEQGKIDAAYEMVTNPLWKSEARRKAGLPR